MTTQPLKLRAAALPAEHGGWALVLEPIALGLLLAPSVAGLWISSAALSCFLARHPLKLALGDRRRGRRLRRTALAERFAAGYAIVATVCFALSISSGRKEFLIPILFAVPFMLVQLAYDALGHSRKLLPELAGAFGVGAIVTATTLARAWPKPSAYALWAIVAGRNIPTILYLRTRLNLRRHGKTSANMPIAIVAQLTALLIVALLSWWKLVPALAVLGFAILTIRAFIGLSRSKLAVAPKKLGIAEIAFGAFTVLTIAGGYLIRW